MNPNTPESDALRGDLRPSETVANGAAPPLLEAALAYAAGDSPLGEPVPVIPINPANKRPLIKWGGDAAPRTPEAVAEAWGEFPDALIGIMLRDTRLVVLDLEGASHGHDLGDVLHELEAAVGELPPTLTATSAGGGMHLYFRAPETVDLDSLPEAILAPTTDLPIPGTEIKRGSSSNNGRYVIAPTLRDGTEYLGRAWTELEEIAELPPVLRPRPAARARLSAPIAEGKIATGHRHAALVKAAGAMRRVGLGESEIYASLAVINEERCDPPAPEEDVREIARDVTGRYVPDEQLGPKPLPPDLTGAEVLDAVEKFIRRYVVLPSAEALWAVVLFVAHTHAIEAADTVPYLHITSPEKRAGKSVLMDVVAPLVAHPLYAVSASAAAIYRGIVDDGVRRTLILDEVDTVFSQKGSEAAEAIRQVLNAGTRRGATVIRNNGNTGRNEEFDPFGPKILGGIAAVPETLEDRCIRISMERAAPERVAQLQRARFRTLQVEGQPLHAQLASWGSESLEELSEIRPVHVPGLSSRAMDGWEPLLAIGEAIGGKWGERARSAATALSTEAADETSQDSMYRRLLVACREVIGGEEFIGSEELVDRLRAHDDEWRWLNSTGLTVHRLGRMLGRYRIKSVRAFASGGQRIRGYQRDGIKRACEVWIGADTDAGPEPTPPDPGSYEAQVAESERVLEEVFGAASE